VAAIRGTSGSLDEATERTRSFLFSSHQARSPRRGIGTPKAERPSSTAIDPSEQHEVIELTCNGDWDRLDDFFAREQLGTYSGLGTANFLPWRRILAIQKDHGAVTCIVERHYVCLDYKSEVASRYAQVDLDHETTAMRLHFFRAPVLIDQLGALSEEQRGSYLGYVVLRPAPLPLVGRAAILPPRGLRTTTIDEPVHLMGQRLSIDCLPFMQQDVNAAACAEVAIWTCLYVAHRRGLIRRHLIAEMDTLLAPLQPMNPANSDGLQIADVRKIARRTGLRTQQFDLFGYGATLPVLPSRNFPEIVKEVKTLRRRLSRWRPINWLSVAGLAKLPDSGEDLTQFVEYALSYTSVGPTSRDTLRLVESLGNHCLAQTALPYLLSRFVGYVDYGDHAVVLLGARQVVTSTAKYPLRQKASHEWKFIIHDDQKGPYLAVSTLLRDCEQETNYQSGISSRFIPSIDDRSDLIERSRQVAGGTVPGEIQLATAVENERNATAMLFPVPARLSLVPSVADMFARHLLRSPLPDVASAHGDGTPTRQHELRSRWIIHPPLVMMGIDYKEARVRALTDAGFAHSAKMFGTLHVAEWIVVVQGMDRQSLSDETPQFDWEVVFDGTASEGVPRIQAARFGRNLLTQHPRAGGFAQEAVLELDRLPGLRPPKRIGKV